jgi:hypothetical protein
MVNGRAGDGDPAMGWRDRLTQVTEATVEAALGEARDERRR